MAKNGRGGNNKDMTRRRDTDGGSVSILSAYDLLRDAGAGIVRQVATALPCHPALTLPQTAPPLLPSAGGRRRMEAGDDRRIVRGG